MIARKLRPIRSGEWGKTRWEYYLADTFPDPALCTSAGCVAIRDLANSEVVLTYTKNRREADNSEGGARWEILGGHNDPLDPKKPNGPKECPEVTAARESLEEGGFIADEMIPFAYRLMYNPPLEEQTGPKTYPEIGYYAYYWAQTSTGLVAPTDPEKPLPGTFPTYGLHHLVECGHMREMEQLIVLDGMNAALEHYGSL